MISHLHHSHTVITVFLLVSFRAQFLIVIWMQLSYREQKSEEIEMSTAIARQIFTDD